MECVDISKPRYDQDWNIALIIRTQQHRHRNTGWLNPETIRQTLPSTSCHYWYNPLAKLWLFISRASPIKSESIRPQLLKYRMNFNVVECRKSFQIDNVNLYKINWFNDLYNNGSLNSHEGVILYIRNLYNDKSNFVQIGESKAIQLNILNLRKQQYLLNLGPQTAL